MLQDYAYIALFGLLAFCFTLVLLALGSTTILRKLEIKFSQAISPEETSSPISSKVIAKEKEAEKPNEESYPTTGDALRPFESGAPTDNKTWVQFRLRYAVLALVFISFDMEMVYMFPWGVVFKKLGFVAFGDMFVFVAILAVGILFAWKSGAFDWED